jgi:hypothetical protein
LTHAEGQQAHQAGHDGCPTFVDTDCSHDIIPSKTSPSRQFPGWLSLLLSATSRLDLLDNPAALPFF